MNPMSLPRATLFTIGALLVALVGWGVVVYSNVSHRNAAEQWATERTALTQEGDALRQQVGALEGTLGQERAAAGDLAALRTQIAEANAKLSDRLSLLGQHERQIASTEADLAGLQDDLGEVDARIERAKASLNQRMAVLGDRDRELAQLNRERDRLESTVAAAQSRFAELGARLNQRMAVLGERDRDLASANGALAEVDRRIAQAEQDWTEVTARLNRRMAVLRDREQEAVVLARAVQAADGRVARLEDQVAGAEAELIDRQTALAVVGVELAQAERTFAHQDAEVAKASEQARMAQAQLAELRGRVDHALLAEEVAELSGRLEALTREVAALDQEIERKGPLAESAMTLNTRVAELEDQLLRLTREREQSAAAVRQAQRELELATAGRDQAADEHAGLVEQVAALDARKEQTEADLARLNAEVRHQNSVFATLEVLKKEQGFLRQLIGSMVDEGSVAHDRVRELRQESEALVAQQLDLEKQLIGKQAEIDVLEKAIATKSQSLEQEPSVRDARAF
jgi:chromosome segregation ATPase